MPWGYVWLFLSEAMLLLLLAAAIIRVRRQPSRLAWIQLLCIAVIVLRLAVEHFIVSPMISRHFASSPLAEFPGWWTAWNAVGTPFMLAAVSGVCVCHFLEGLWRAPESDEGHSRRLTIFIATVLGGLALGAILSATSHWLFRFNTAVATAAQWLGRLLIVWYWGAFAAGTILMLRRERGWPLAAQLAGSAVLALWAAFFLGHDPLGLIPVPSFGQESTGWVFAWVTTTKLVRIAALWMFAAGYLAMALKLPAARPAAAPAEPASSPAPEGPGLLRRATPALVLAAALVAVFAFLEFWGIRGGRMPSARQRTANVIRMLARDLVPFVNDERQLPWPRPEAVTIDTVIDPREVYRELCGRGEKKYFRFGMPMRCPVPSWAVADGCFVDAWGRPIQFRMDPDSLAPVVWSYGPDGVDDTNDGASADPVRFPKTYYCFSTGRKSDDIVERLEARGRSRSSGKAGRGLRPPLLPLKGDTEARGRLQDDLANRLGPDASEEEQARWDWRVAHDAGLARYYEYAARVMMAAADRDPADWTLHLAASVYWGKAGFLAEAEFEAKEALKLKGADAWHPNIVLACWEYRMGKRTEAMARMNRVRMPENRKEHRLYCGNLAAFAAISGDEQQLESAISKAVELDGSEASLAFFRRDVLFDPYRTKPWFIKLVGETLENK
jgi:hypothetical protein